MTYSKDHPFTIAKTLLFKAADERSTNPLFGAFFQDADCVGVVSLKDIDQTAKAADWAEKLFQNNLSLDLKYPKCISLEYDNSGRVKLKSGKAKLNGLSVFAKCNNYFDHPTLTWYKGIIFTAHLIGKKVEGSALNDTIYFLCRIDDKAAVYKVDADFKGDVKGAYFKSLTPLEELGGDVVYALQAIDTYLSGKCDPTGNKLLTNGVNFHHFH